MLVSGMENLVGVLGMARGGCLDEDEDEGEVLH